MDQGSITAVIGLDLMPLVTRAVGRPQAPRSIRSSRAGPGRLTQKGAPEGAFPGTAGGCYCTTMQLVSDMAYWGWYVDRTGNETHDPFCQ